MAIPIHGVDFMIVTTWAYSVISRFRSSAMLLRLIAILLVMIAMTACGTIQRHETLPLAADQITRVADPRTGANDIERLRDLTADMSRRLANREQPMRMLVLSGGGANGAYGAGVLVGWTERGDRPDFDIVTGVSTGALAAPFAFLGRDWDAKLAEAYTGGGASRILSPRSLAAFRNPSLFSAAALRGLVEQNVTPELLNQIAAEHARGRRLLVATTNLDTEETVVWDMGLIAAQYAENPEAMPLFRDVLTASASIPGVFPPVMIAGLNANGAIARSMHVDGGVNTPFLAVPEDLLLWTDPEAQGGPRGGSIHIIMNGQLGRTIEITPGRLDKILLRTFDSLHKSMLRTAIAATAGFAARNHLQMEVTAVPDDIPASPLRFDVASMTRLFETGRSRAASGTAWASVGASGEPTPLAAAITTQPPPNGSDDQ